MAATDASKVGAKDDSSVQLSFPDGADTLFIGLSGIQLSQKSPTFEWRAAFKALPVATLFIRDFAQVYYFHGIRGISHDMDSSVAWIREQMAARGITKLAVFGASSAGYNALLFGYLLNAAEVHAFAPVTRLPTRTWTEIAQLIARNAQGRRLARTQLHLRLDPRIDHTYYDLPGLLRRGDGQTRYHVYYGDQRVKDAAYAHLLDGAPGVRLHAHPSSAHRLALELKERGELEPLVEACYERLTGQKPAGGSSGIPPRAQPVSA